MTSNITDIAKSTNAPSFHLRTDWQNFGTACLDVSLHNRYQEGDYLSGLFQWVSKRFERCLINLGDTLHRHNLVYQYGCKETAHNKSRQMGEEWAANNASCFDFLDIPHCLIRGDDWLVDPDFESVHEALWLQYYGDANLRHVINQDIEGFLKRNPDLPKDDARKGSLSYLMEETATDIILGQRGGVAHFYPADRHACYYHLIENTAQLPQLVRGLEHSAFKRYSPSKVNLKQAKAA